MANEQAACGKCPESLTIYSSCKLNDMITHLFKLIWNKKKQNFLLITEMLVSFLVVFAVFTLLVYNYKNYKAPMGMDYDDVWVVNYTPPENINRPDSVAMFIASLKQMIHSMPQVKEMSFTSGNVPFSMNTSNSMMSYNNRQVMTNIYGTEDSYLKLLNMHMLEGRWFSSEDNAVKIPSVVINQQLKEKLFGNESPVGKVMGTDTDKSRVIGVVNDVKSNGDYQRVESGVYKRMDSGWMRWAGTMLLKVQPGTGAAFESKLYKSLSNSIGTTIEIEHLDKKRVNKNKLMLVPSIIMLVVAGFLIINVALGLFGVLWYNINKRKGEIGLRRAVGASGNAVSKQLVGEALVLSTISLIVGSFFAVQFPLMNVFDLSANIYLIAILFSVLFIYGLVFICALYPGRQAAAIYPAVALHEE
jgi:putative ABC transport system permease protein